MILDANTGSGFDTPVEIAPSARGRGRGHVGRYCGHIEVEEGDVLLKMLSNLWFLHTLSDVVPVGHDTANEESNGHEKV